MKIAFHRGFKKYYRKLKPGERKKLEKRLRLFAEDPYHPILDNHALRERYKGFRSIDITGDLRALFELKEGENTAVFIIVDTHSNLYG
ncbi:MAG: hypothetical protein WD889_02415 [Candidatus Colwellbacteria bacterium]